MYGLTHSVHLFCFLKLNCNQLQILILVCNNCEVCKRPRSGLIFEILKWKTPGLYLSFNAALYLSDQVQR